ncbi:MAG: DUF1847 domain-containing protein [Candidatus Lokiarchaeota archaeon]|nr:DUF1847 domain-containing protein [Candidatus Lokiarchaeota archaeon]
MNALPEEKDNNPKCHQCESIKNCAIGRPNKKKEDCPMKFFPEIEKEALELYQKDEFIKRSTGVASIVEAKGYIKWPRLKDTIEYAKGMGYNKLELAFCVGLHSEAQRIAEILIDYGFKIVSVCCKTGSVPKKKVGVPEEYIMFSKTGYPIGNITCNPAACLFTHYGKTFFSMDLNEIKRMEYEKKKQTK